MPPKRSRSSPPRDILENVLQQLDLLLKEQENVSQWMKNVDERLNLLSNRLESSQKGDDLLISFLLLQRKKIFEG